jgi:hypothetical protein
VCVCVCGGVRRVGLRCKTKLLGYRMCVCVCVCVCVCLWVGVCVCVCVCVGGGGRELARYTGSRSEKPMSEGTESQRGGRIDGHGGDSVGGNGWG